MKRPLIAHQTPDRTRTQLLETHSRNVGERCGAACQQIGLEHLGRLTGLLHDLGKAAHEVQDYLYGALIVGKLNHSSAGMRWVWEAFGKTKHGKVTVWLHSLPPSPSAAITERAVIFLTRKTAVNPGWNECVPRKLRHFMPRAVNLFHRVHPTGGD